MKRILVCLDPSPRASHVLERSCAVARASGAKLVLFRAVGLPHDAHVPPEALSMSPNALVELWRRNAERDLEAIRSTLPPEIVESVVVHIGSPWSAICAIARELDVDFDRGRLPRLRAHRSPPGTTAAKVVNHADRSVLAGRATLTRERQRVTLGRRARAPPRLARAPRPVRAGSVRSRTPADGASARARRRSPAVSGSYPPRRQPPGRLRLPLILDAARAQPRRLVPVGRRRRWRARRREDKPILLSIGYSSCHWCHVMEAEVFEKDDVAAFLNATS